MKSIKFFQVDAFTDKPFKGNPAAICILENELQSEVMQAIAAENNLAETAFVSKRDEGFNLKWFTPTVEVALCGHATLATAHILWQEKILNQNETARFYTKSGWLSATKKDEWIELDFPAATISSAEIPDGLEEVLGGKIINSVYAKDRFIVELGSAQEVADLKPDFNALKNYEMVVATSRDENQYDFVSRSFAGAFGIDEDPVTGSSHCGLVPYWAEKLNKTEFFAYQASARGGELRLKASGDRVLIAGRAVTVIKGVFFL